jgi:hypothetical protein
LGPSSGAYGEFIETDAAINHGALGVPLFNTRGECHRYEQEDFKRTRDSSIRARDYVPVSPMSNARSALFISESWM